MLDSKFFFFIAPEIVSRYRKHIFFDGKDIDGKSFKSYSKEYSKRKRGNKFKRQASQFKNSTSPVLTSDLLRDFSLIKTMTNGFQLGFAAFGARVQHLKKMGRVLSAPNQALPNGVIQYLSKEASIYINKKLPKGKKRYRIGK